MTRPKALVTTAIYEGSRPVPCSKCRRWSARQISASRAGPQSAWSNTRLNMLLAVLEKIVGIPLTNQDVYVNVVGGIRPEGTGADLAAALAISYSLV